MGKRSFRHLEFVPRRGLHSGMITACCELDRENETIRVSFAFCSPREKQFSKKKGRLIAEGRLDKGLYAEVPIDVEDSNRSLFHIITDAIWEEALLDYDTVLLAAGKQPPQWVYDSIELYCGEDDEPCECCSLHGCCSGE